MALTFAEHQAQHRRQALLGALANAAAYRANVVLLVHYLAGIGHGAGHDQVAADLAWLRDAGLVDLQADTDPAIATLTVRGLDVAAGRTQVPGVARPHPGG